MKNIQTLSRILIVIFTAIFSISPLSAQEKLGGLALYTVRDDMAKNPKATLLEVAQIGYENIEAAGYKEGLYYGMKPEDFKTYVAKIGLKTLSTHQSAVTLENMNIMFVDAKNAGFEYFVVPIPPMGLFHYDKITQTMSMSGGAENLAQILNEMGEAAHKVGLKLLYHNHDFEFKTDKHGIVPIEYLLENCNPKYVNFQMDLFWVIKAGANPISYFKKYPKRFKSWHVKDMDDEGKFAPVGAGNIDFTKISHHKELSGMEFYLVEQDLSFDQKPLDVIKISFEGIKKIGFE